MLDLVNIALLAALFALAFAYVPACLALKQAKGGRG